MAEYRTPGVYREDRFPPRARELETGVPVFLGLAGAGPVEEPRRITHWPGFEELFGSASDNFLTAAVRGFFANEGTACYVLRLDPDLPPEPALESGLRQIDALDGADLVCTPDLFSSLDPQDDPELALRLQAAVVAHCDALGDRFALLDSLTGAAIADAKVDVLTQRQLLSKRIVGAGAGAVNAALYYPWVRPPDRSGFVPPCGHVAGVFARSDRRTGVHKAPANEVLNDILDLEVNLTANQQGPLNEAGINALRAFPGRGIRVWGARTLSQANDWRYVNVRRVFLTAGRWAERNLKHAAFEPHDSQLWARIRRDLGTYLEGQYRRGGFKGAAPEEAFYVKCDAENNPPEVREAGQVVTEIGLATAVPGEFVVARIIHGAGGVTVSGP
jgi:hypothetical protein